MKSQRSFVVWIIVLLFVPLTAYAIDTPLIEPHLNQLHRSYISKDSENIAELRSKLSQIKDTYLSRDDRATLEFYWLVFESDRISESELLSPNAMATALKIAERANWFKAEFLSFEAIKHVESGELDKAIAKYKQSVDIAIEVGDPKQLVKLRHRLAIEYAYQNMLSQAMEQITTSRMLLSNDSPVEMHAHIAIAKGYLFSEAERQLEAINTFSQGVELDVDNVLTRFELMYGLGLSYRNEGELIKAQEQMQKVVTLSEGMRTQRFLFYALSGLGSVNVRMKEFDAAILVLERAMTLDVAEVDEFVVEIYKNLAVSYSAKGEHRKALDAAFRAEVVANKITGESNNVWLTDIDLVRARVYGNMGEFGLAYDAHQSYIENLKLAYRKEERALRENLLTEFNMKQKDAENDALKRENEIHIVALEKEKEVSALQVTVIILVTILVILSALLTIVLMRSNKKLHRQSDLDPLTGCYNRRFLEGTLQKLLAKVSDKTKGFGVIVIDCDHFKKVNDTYGHEEGDKVLKSLTSVVKDVIRPEDYLARIGGEEFVVILPNITEQSLIEEISERVRAKVESTTYRPNQAVPTTISLGAIYCKQGDSPLFSLIKQADDLLYLAKKQGRNRSISAIATS